jgi:hypothetical protein
MFHFLLILATSAVGAALAYVLYFAQASTKQKHETMEEAYFQPLLEATVEGTGSGEGDGYRWSQTAKEIEVVVPLSPEVKSKDVACKVLPSSISLIVGGKIIVRGRLLRRVVAEECDWMIEGAGEARVLRLTLLKLTPTLSSQHWAGVLAPADGADAAASLRS